MGSLQWKSKGKHSYQGARFESRRKRRNAIRRVLELEGQGQVVGQFVSMGPPGLRDGLT